MFGFRKRNDGFEWRQYVRTTIRLRRADRRARLEGAKHAAVDGLKGAGRAGAVAGATGFWALLATLKVLLTVLLAAPGVLWRVAIRALRPLGSWLWHVLQPLGRALGRPGLGPLLLLIGAAAGFSAVISVGAGSLDRETAIAAAVALGAVLLAAAPKLLSERGLQLPFSIAPGVARLTRRWPGLSKVRAGYVLAGVAAAGAIGGWLLWRGPAPIGLASLPGLGGKIIEGRALAVSGDVLRIGGSVVRLAGIEAPERGQRCARPGSARWSCGEAAVEALSRAVRGNVLRCEIGGSDDGGRPMAVCRAGAEDIAATLVRQGAVFSSGGLFARYGTHENEARQQKAGLWRSEAERPSQWRAKRWDEAKRAAPDGCPIKGHVAAGTRVYVLPWSSEYERLRVRTGRGGRWFCTEAEAVAAGWRAADGG